MAVLQIKGGTTSAVAAYTPVPRELVIDTTKNRLVIGDGATAGGVHLSVDKADTLSTAHTIRIDLTSTTATGFDGSADVTPGVNGVLPLANGGLGSDMPAARTALGAAASGSNADITGLSGLTAAVPLPGVTNASSAAAGKIGQMVEANASAVALVSGAAKTLTSISLPAGEWDVYGEVQHVYSATSSSGVVAGVGLADNTDPGFPYKYANYSVNGGTVAQVATPRRFLQLSAAATTVYLLTAGTFATGTCAAAGYLHARRIR